MPHGSGAETEPRTSEQEAEGRNGAPQPERPGGELRPIGPVVAELRRLYPDITHSSLRFLEREGLLAPRRTPGGHRLYSPADVDRIRTIKAWQAQRLSLDEIRRRLEAQQVLWEPAALAAPLLAALLHSNQAAERLILQADDLGVPLARLFQDVLSPVMAAIGERWARGVLRVGQEHEITEVARGLIAELARRHARPAVDAPIMLAACVAGEHHDLGLRMIVALLRERGQRVQFLGADVGARFLREEVAMRRPCALLLSATLPERLPAIAATAAAVAGAAAPQPLLFLGGQAVSGHEAGVQLLGVTPIGEPDLDAALHTILSTALPASAS